MIGSRIAVVITWTLLSLGISEAVVAGGDPPLTEAEARNHPVFDKLLPPPGPVKATMKTLQQVEPRIDANAQISGSPNGSIVLDKPGSYYLTDNVKGIWGRDGISMADGVTLDLNGFRVDGTDAGEGRTGISVGQNCDVFNGVVSNWSGAGISGGGNSRLIGLKVIRCSLQNTGGASIRTDARAIVRDCHVQFSGSNGIRVGEQSVVENCFVSHSENNGILIDIFGLAATVKPCVIRNCVSSSNNESGIVVSYSSQVSNCLTYLNDASGISANRGSTVENCSSFLDEVGFRFYAEVSAVNCIAVLSRDNGFQSGDNSTLTRCRTYNCNGHGFAPSQFSFLHAPIYRECVASNNNRSGYLLQHRNALLQDCRATGNSIGVEMTNNAHSATIDSCNFRDNGTGIQSETDDSVFRNNTFMQSNALTVTGLNNLIINNFILGGAKSVNIVPGNKDAAIVDHPDNAGPWSNLAL